MKKVISLLLCILLSLSLLAACGAAQEPEPTQAVPETPVIEESPEEANVLKIMILGSSRSVNTFQLLYEAFKDQMPDQELVLGVMYYSGCSMTMHVNFIKDDAAVYRYYRNDSGRWDIVEGVKMDQGLKDQKWDVILLQAGNGDLANSMNLPCREFLVDYVSGILGDHPHTFWWHSTWFNSTDPSLYNSNATKLDPYAIDQYSQLTNNIETAKATVLEDPMFEGRITSGTPMMYALKVLEVPEVALYRDHTHLSDFGCLLVGYAFYAQYTGNPVTQVNLDKIPVYLRHEKYQSQGDMEVTEEMKQTILKTVEYTLANPWSVPVKE